MEQVLTELIKGNPYLFVGAMVTMLLLLSPLYLVILFLKDIMQRIPECLVGIKEEMVSLREQFVSVKDELKDMARSFDHRIGELETHVKKIQER